MNKTVFHKNLFFIFLFICNFVLSAVNSHDQFFSSRNGDKREEENKEESIIDILGVDFLRHVGLLEDDVKESESLRSDDIDINQIGDGHQFHLDFPQQFLDRSKSKERSTEQVEGYIKYKKAEQILKSSYSNKAEAYKLLNEASDSGVTEATLKIAWAKLIGNNQPQDIDYAYKIFSKYANDGEGDSLMGIGFMHAIGLKYNYSQAHALIYYTFAAAEENLMAKMALGYRYWSGINVEVNCELAQLYYSSVAKTVAKEVKFSGGPIVQKIRLMEEFENPGSTGIIDIDLIEYYHLMAEKGDSNIQFGLGQILFQGGKGIAPDINKAFHYFLKSAESGNAAAMAYLGKIYLEGCHTIKPNNLTAYLYFKKAADMGNPAGQSGLGVLYLYGFGVERNYNTAFSFFQLAAKQGWGDGQLHIGILYFYGLGIRRDYKLAYKYFNLASQSGSIIANYNLAEMHAEGIGVIQSCPYSVELYKLVAERGKWGELLYEAHEHYKEERYDEAYTIYALLAELGYEIAQSNAAYILDKGDIIVGYQTNFDKYERAYNFWHRATLQGYYAAQLKLGDYHYYGLGRPIDYEMAAIRYKLAYDRQHNAQAMFNLGYMYEHGISMNQDLNLAKRCYDAAAEASPDAKVPVIFALMKLSVHQFLNNLKLLSWMDNYLNDFDFLFNSQFDYYIICLLLSLFMFAIYFRHPRPIR